MTPVTDDVREAHATLLRAVEPGTSAVVQLVGQVGVVETVALIRSGVPIGGCDVEGMRARIEPGCGARDLDRAAASGGRLVVPGDPEWPGCLDDLARLGQASFGVYVRGAGRLDDRAARAVAVVGTRASTDYGDHVASELACDLAEAGWAVVSGLAYGIDAAAHRGALAAVAGAGTIAVVACGIDQVYPKAHTGLARRIMADGLLVTEQPPGAAPQRLRFLVRNRVIAALGAGTVVVEAAARSGARSTARHAGALGRAVLAVPGPVTSAASVGCHQLLKDDPLVGLATGVADVLELVGAIGELAPRPQGETTDRDRLPPVTRRVLEAVPVHKPAAVIQLANTAGISVPRIVDTLGQLVAAGYVETAEGGWRLSPRERARRATIRGQTEFALDDW